MFRKIIFVLLLLPAPSFANWECQEVDPNDLYETVGSWEIRATKLISHEEVRDTVRDRLVSYQCITQEVQELLPYCTSPMIKVFASFWILPDPSHKLPEIQALGFVQPSEEDNAVELMYLLTNPDNLEIPRVQERKQSGAATAVWKKICETYAAEGFRKITLKSAGPHSDGFYVKMGCKNKGFKYLFFDDSDGRTFEYNLCAATPMRAA